MGMNFYWHGECGECGNRVVYHVGKSSAGWYFALHVIPGTIDTLDDWKRRFDQNDSLIVDEYGETISPEEMMTAITDRQWCERADCSAEFLEENSAEMGINNLLCCKCCRHGEGPWDYVTGVFS